MPYTPPSTLQRLGTSLRLFRKLFNRIPKSSVLTLDLRGALSEKPSPPAIPFGPPPPLTLPSLLSALRLAAVDPRIAHLHVTLAQVDVGWAKCFEIRRHLEYFRASGRGVSVYMEAGGAKEFFLAMGFALYMPPEGSLAFRGFSASGAFVRGVLEKIGVEPQVERIGKYKSAGDQLDRRDMSDAQREVLTAVIGQVYDIWTKSVVEATGVKEEVLKEVIDQSPWQLKRYVDLNLVTQLCYESDVIDALKVRFGKKWSDSDDKAVIRRPLKAVSVGKYVRKTTPRLLGLRGGKKIAVIRFVGAITSGKSGSSPAMGATVGSDTMLEIIRKVRYDKSIAGCIVRCDSPGGSALASDLMWSELRKLAEEKPTVASQSDVAASGGYYISMATEIVSEALTLTGSVGVVTAKPSLEKLYEKIGFMRETVSVGSRYAELLVDNRPFNEEELAYFKEGARLAYNNFVTLAANSRNKTFEEMDKVAQGRVWTGLQAREQGMVDYIGGMEKAVEVIKGKLEMKEGDRVQLVEMKMPISLRERLSMMNASALLSMEDNNGGVQERLLREPLAMADFDASMGPLSPLTRLMMDAVTAPLRRQMKTGGVDVLQTVLKAALERL